MWSLYPNCKSPYLSLLQNENENENKINQNSSVNTGGIQLKNERINYIFKILEVIIFFSKIYKVCNNMSYYICVYCELDDNRSVGTERKNPSSERLLRMCKKSM